VNVRTGRGVALVRTPEAIQKRRPHPHTPPESSRQVRPAPTGLWHFGNLLTLWTWFRSARDVWSTGDQKMSS